MDVFSIPDLFVQEQEPFNGLSREEKMPVIIAAIADDKTDTIKYEEGIFDCGYFSYLTLFNTFGVKDLDDWGYIDKFAEKIITNGKYNIPVFSVGTITQGSSSGIGTEVSGHSINGIFVGPENPNDKHDPTDFNQWYFFEPQNDEEVRPGDFSMNIRL